MEKRPILKKAGIVAGILVLFFIVIQIFQYRSTHFTVDKKTFNVKTSIDEIMADDYKKIPYLQPAAEHGLVDKNLFTKDLPEIQRDLKIERVWIQPGRLYMIYSIKLLKTDKKPNNVPVLDFTHVDFGRQERDKLLSVANPQPEEGGETATIGNRVYRSVIYNLQYLNLDDGADLYNQFNTPSEINSMNIKDPVLVTGDKKHKLGPINIKASYHADKYLLGKKKLEKVIKYSDQCQVRFQQVKKYYNYSKINYQLEGCSKPIIEFKLKPEYHVSSKIANEQMKRMLQAYTNTGPSMTLSTDRKNSLLLPYGVSSMTVKPDMLIKKTDRSITVDINKKQLSLLKKGKELKVETRGAYEFPVTITLDDQGSYYNMLDFQYEPGKEGLQPTFRSTTDLQRFEQLKENATNYKGEGREQEIARLANIPVAELDKQNGIPVLIEQSYWAGTGGSSSIYSMNFPKQEIEDASELHLTIKPLLTLEKYKGKTDGVKIDLMK